MAGMAAESPIQHVTTVDSRATAVQGIPPAFPSSSSAYKISYKIQP